MAADKRSLLRDALKQTQKGQLDKAIAAYRAILKADPKDVKVHNALGDLYLRRRMKKEAVAEYLEVANLYEADGYALRSIAICQKILNIDAEMVDVRLKLADLYSQQRLMAEAKAQYLSVADHYDRKGDVGAALDVFRKIADLDPRNLSVRVKLAGMFEKQSLTEKAAREYARAADGYRQQEETDRAVELYGKALALHDQCHPARRGLAEHHAARGEWAEAEEALRTLMAQQVKEPETERLYAAALGHLGRGKEAIGIWEGLSGKEPSSLALQTGLGRAHLQAGHGEEAFGILSRVVAARLTEGKTDRAEALARELAEALPEDDRAQQKLLEVFLKKDDREAAAGAYLRLAEIYEQKGLLRNAAGALEKLRELRPDDEEIRVRIEKLHAAAPAPPPAAPSPAPEPAAAAPPAPEEEEEDLVELDLVGDDLSTIAIPDVESEELEIEFDVEEPAAAGPASDEDTAAGITALMEQGLLDRAAAAAGRYSAAHPDDEGGLDLLREAHRRRGDRNAECDALLRTAALRRRQGRGEAAQEAYRTVLDLDPRNEAATAALGDLLADEAAAPPAEATAAPATEEIPAEVPGKEEVDLEAAAAVADASSGVDELADFSLEIGDTAAAAGEAPPAEEPTPESSVDTLEAERTPPAKEPSGETTPVEETVPEPPAGAFEVDLSAAAPAAGEAAAAAPPEPPAPGTETGGDREIGHFLAEADFYLQQGLLDEAEFLYRKLAMLDPENLEIARQIERIEEQRGEAGKVHTETGEDAVGLVDEIDSLFEEAAPPAAPPAAEAPGEAAPGGEFTQFLSDLRDELEAEPPAEAAAPPAAAGEEEGLHEIFQEFQRGIKEQLGEEDFETHYNLGIAYKEMGLMEEALGEFILAEKSPARQMDAVSMIALCLTQVGRADEAAAKLRQGLEAVPEGTEEHKGLLYDLADLEEQRGDTAGARDLFAALFELDPDYRDVRERLAESGGGEPDPAPEETPRTKKPRVSYL